MGLFDSLMVTCPNCDTGIEFQSKAGKKILEMYNIDNCPQSILGDLANKKEACEHCGHVVILRVKTTAWAE